MAISKDLWAIAQESANSPEGLTPEAALTRLKQFHNERMAAVRQRKAQGVVDDAADLEAMEDDEALNDPDFAKEFLPQALYDVQQKLKGQRKEAAPKSEWERIKGMRYPGPAGFSDPEVARRDLKVLAEAAATAVPGMQIPSMAGKAAFSGLPLLMMVKRLMGGGKPQDLATSAAQTATGLGAGKLVGPAAEGLNKLFKLKPGGFNGAEVLLSGLSGGANAAVPPMFNDREGFGGPDENTASRFAWGTGLGALFGLGKQFIGNQVAGTGTRTLENLEKQEMIPQGAVDKYGAPSLGTPRIIDTLSKKADVQKSVALNEVLRRGVENERQLDPGKYSLKTMREASAAKAANPGAEYDPSLTRFAEGGVSPESVRKGITKALDGVFKPSNSLTPMDVAEREAADMGKALIQLHKGDKSAALKAVMGYFAERFYRKPSLGQAEPAEALETLSAVAGGDRLNKLFQGMGFSGREASQAVATLTKQTAAIDKINQMGKLAGLQPESPITAVRASPTSTGVLANVRDWGRKLNPRTASEAILRGQNQLLSSDQQKVLAGWLRRTEKSPLSDMGGATSAIQTVFSGARDPEKR